MTAAGQPAFRHRWRFLLAAAFAYLAAVAGTSSVAADGARTPAMAKLQPLLGRWTGTATIPATQYSPAASSAFEATFRWILSGNHLEGTVRYEVGGQPFEARLVVTWEPNEGRYSALWIDSLVPGSVRFSGVLRDASLALAGQRRQNGQSVREELQLSWVASQSLTLTSSSNALGDMKVGFRAHATRAKDS